MTTNDIYALIDQIIGDSFDEHHHEARARHSGRRLANQDRPSGHSSRSVQAAVRATRVAAAHPSDRRTTRRLPRRWRTCCPGSGFIPAWAGQPARPVRHARMRCLSSHTAQGTSSAWSSFRTYLQERYPAECQRKKRLCFARSRSLRRRLQLRPQTEDPQGPHAPRVHLQMLDFRA